MNLFKRFFLLVIIVLGTQKLFGQVFYLSYTFDSSGNRTKRIRTTGGSFVSLEEEEEVKQKSELAKSLEGNQVTISFESIQNNISVHISNYNSDINGSISIYNSTGAIIKKSIIEKEVNIFDWSNQPSGVYLVQVNVSGQFTTRKIVK